MSLTKKRITIIMRELGRVNSRLNSLNHSYQDVELVAEIAEAIARNHSRRFNPKTLKNENSKH